MFQVGQKVVCVRNEPAGQEVKYATGKRSVKIWVGSIYTVREIDVRAVHLHGVATVRLHEVSNPIYPSKVGPWENGYPATCFRPITERKTDIGIFTAMLTPNKQKVRA